MWKAKQTNVGIRNKKPSQKSTRCVDMEWLYKDTERRQREADAERRERNRRLAERDAEYARLFPHLLKHGRLKHEVTNDPIADLRRRCVG